MEPSQQVVVIHGGNVFNSQDDFISSLKNKEVTRDSFKRKVDWKANLQKELGISYEVFAPHMPESDNATYDLWKIWFEKMIPFLSDNVIMVGHSLGAIFLVKYFSQEDFTKKIDGLFLVSAPFEGSDDDPLGTFQRTDSVDGLKTQVEKIFLYHSTNDEVVPYAHMEKYHELLPTAIVRTFCDRGHFFIESFPEIVADIRLI